MKNATLRQLKVFEAVARLLRMQWLSSEVFQAASSTWMLDVQGFP